jgi:hypothetical protein
MKAVHADACLSVMSEMRSKRRFSPFWVENVKCICLLRTIGSDVSLHFFSTRHPVCPIYERWQV